MATGFINSTQCANFIFLLIALQQSNWTHSPGQGQRTRSVICLANAIIRRSEKRFGNRIPWLCLALCKNRPSSWSTSWNSAPCDPAQGTIPFAGARPKSKLARCVMCNSSLRKCFLEERTWVLGGNHPALIATMPLRCHPGSAVLAGALLHRRVFIWRMFAVFKDQC